MLTWKRYAAVLAGLSVLALAGCSQSGGSGGPGAAGPNDADKAAIAHNPKDGQSAPGAQAAAAKAAAANARPAPAPAAGTTGQ